MIQAFWTALLYLVTFAAFAYDSSPSVFYPLPMESQGRMFVAKQLSLSSNGGLWIHDVKGKVLFFDGQSVAPKWGSALPYEVNELVVENGQFWSYKKNVVFRSYANRPRRIEFELPAGSEIQKMGISNGYVWLTDDTHFYSYHIVHKTLNAYTLQELFNFNHASNVAVNDAIMISKHWTLATNIGVFISEEKGFRHVARSKGSPIHNLHFSANRRELVMGSPKGAIVYDISNTSKPKYIIPTPDVTTVSETTQAYWIGTEDGLYVYSFITGDIKKYSGERRAGFSLTGRRINALVNDNSGGLWIATNKNIHYYSLFGDKFQRFPSNLSNSDVSHSEVNNLIAMLDKSGYWMLRKDGLHQLSQENNFEREHIYAGQVNSVKEAEGKLWLATNKGMVVLNVKDGSPVINVNLTHALSNIQITHVDADSKGRLWFANDKNVWCLNIGSGELKIIAENWISPSYPQARLESMLVTSADHVVFGTEHGVYLLRDGQLKFVSQTAPYGPVRSMAEGRTDQIWIASTYGISILDINTEALVNLPLVDDHVAPHCLVNNTNGHWLTSSAGLSHYSIDGQLVAHYGQPFGLLNHEFRNGFCLAENSDDQALLLGSWHSVIRFNSSDLMVSSVPKANVLFSQVKVNQELIDFGSVIQTNIAATFGETIAIQMGIMPSISGASLEYKLNQDSIWTPLEGYQIVMEGLMPGDYTLSVRPVVNGIEHGGVKTLSFTVTEPWYFNSLAIVMYFAFGLFILLGFVYWRSRMMVNANRKLKAQVALKTNQLRHQSRVLLTNNHQLRKQIQVRRLIFNKAIQSFKDRLRLSDKQLGQGELQAQPKMVDQIASELELLVNMGESQGENSVAYNLSMIFSSTLNGWQEEFTKAGLSVELDLETNKDHYVLLDYFNLDVMLNLIFDSLVKRSVRNQIVHIKLYCTEKKVFIHFLDSGEPIDFDREGGWREVTKLLDESGGYLSSDISEGQNMVQLWWTQSHTFDEKSIIELDDFGLKNNHIDNVDSFFQRLEALVLNHYTDPEFSTSTAAKMLFVSERSLQRRFKGATQRTFSDYLSEIRLDNACRHLLAGGKVADVAFECGFNDPSYFSQRFKHRFGVSPTQFVEQSDKEETD